MKIAALFTLALAASSLGGSRSATVRVGPLEAAYDPAVMSVQRFDGGLVLQGDEAWSRTAAYVEVSETAPCSAAAMLTALGERGDTSESTGARVLASGLTLHWAMTWSGCRARSGRPIAVCIRHGGITTQARGLDLGCRTPLNQDALILGLLEGARPAGEAG